MYVIDGEQSNETHTGINMNFCSLNVQCYPEEHTWSTLWLPNCEQATVVICTISD